MKHVNSFLFTVVVGVFLTLSCDTSALAASSIVKQWTRFEDTLISSKDYDNPVQDIKVTVEFTCSLCLNPFLRPERILNCG